MHAGGAFHLGNKRFWRFRTYGTYLSRLALVGLKQSMFAWRICTSLLDCLRSLGWNAKYAVLPFFFFGFVCKGK